MVGDAGVVGGVVDDGIDESTELWGVALCLVAPPRREDKVSRFVAVESCELFVGEEFDDIGIRFLIGIVFRRITVAGRYDFTRFEYGDNGFVEWTERCRCVSGGEIC